MNWVKRLISVFSKTSHEQAESISYDSIAEEFSNHSDKQFITAHYERPYIISHLPDLKGLTFLDAGCGAGYFSVYAINQGGTVIAVDSNEKMIEITRRKTNNMALLHQVDLSNGNLKFLADETIDVIVCSLTLHYIENWKPVLTEFYRILKKGGKCIISVHHPFYDYMNFGQGRYFDKRIVTDLWSGFGKKKLKVNYYVRPLKDYLAPVLESKFKIVAIDEPEPQIDFKNEDINSYDRLSGNPGFLFFRLEK